MSSPISFMKSRNRIGPTTDPWGTPEVTGMLSEWAPSTTMRCEWSHRKSLIHDRFFPSDTIPVEFRQEPAMWHLIKGLTEINNNTINLFVGREHCMEIMVEVDELGVTWQVFSEAMFVVGWGCLAPLSFRWSVNLADHDVFEHFRAHTG